MRRNIARNVKLQSAMEYLMTYGWAILIIAVVLGVLFQMGAFSSSSITVRVPPGACKVLRTSAAVNLVGQCSGILPQYVAQFNGQSSIVTLASPSSLPPGSITVSAWIYLSSLVNTDATLYNSNPQSLTLGYSWVYIDPNGWINEQYANGVTHLTLGSNIALSTNQWYYVALEYDVGGSLASIYINGALHGQTGISGFVQTARSNGYIGTYQGTSSATYVFNGIIANMQVYNTSLDVNQIQTLYQEGIGGAPVSPQNIVGWWPLNGDTKDYSGNNNNGVPTAVTYTAQYGK